MIYEYIIARYLQSGIYNRRFCLGNFTTVLHAITITVFNPFYIIIIIFMRI